jgi:hypothetical protein
MDYSTLRRWIKTQAAEVEKSEKEAHPETLEEFGIGKHDDIDDLETSDDDQSCAWSAGYCYAMREVLRHLNRS